MKSNSCILIAAMAAVLILSDAHAQDLHPSRRPSPAGIARTHVGNAYVKVTYGRPYIRGRKIFGTDTDDQKYLVPFGQIWRTGANEATELTMTEPMTIAGKPLDAGTYAVFTEPGADTWTVHFSPQLGLDGTGIFDPATQELRQVYDPTQDILVVSVPSGKLSEIVDQFTIEFEDADVGTDMVLRWENTEVRIPVRPTT